MLVPRVVACVNGRTSARPTGRYIVHCAGLRMAPAQASQQARHDMKVMLCITGFLELDSTLVQDCVRVCVRVFVCVSVCTRLGLYAQ